MTADELEGIQRAANIAIGFLVAAVVVPVLAGFLILLQDYLNERREKRR